MHRLTREEPAPPTTTPPTGQPPRDPAAEALRFEQLLRFAPVGDRAGRHAARADAHRWGRIRSSETDERPEDPVADPNGRSDAVGSDDPPPCSTQEGARAAVPVADSMPVRRRYAAAGESSGESQQQAADARDSTVDATRLGAPVRATDATSAATFDLQGIARRVEGLVRSATVGMESWRVSLDLEPDLPQTILRIRGSRNWIALRFSTQSAAAARLLSLHMPALEEQLEESLDMRHQIDVDLE